MEMKSVWRTGLSIGLKFYFSILVGYMSYIYSYSTSNLVRAFFSSS